MVSPVHGKQMPILVRSATTAVFIRSICCLHEKYTFFVIIIALIVLIHGENSQPQPHLLYLARFPANAFLHGRDLHSRRQPAPCIWQVVENRPSCDPAHIWRSGLPVCGARIPPCGSPPSANGGWAPAVLQGSGVCRRRSAWSRPSPHPCGRQRRPGACPVLEAAAEPPLREAVLHPGQCGHRPGARPRVYPVSQRVGPQGRCPVLQGQQHQHGGRRSRGTSGGRRVPSRGSREAPAGTLTTDNLSTPCRPGRLAGGRGSQGVRAPAERRPSGGLQGLYEGHLPEVQHPHRVLREVYGCGAGQGRTRRPSTASDPGSDCPGAFRPMSGPRVPLLWSRPRDWRPARV